MRKAFAAVIAALALLAAPTAFAQQQFKMRASLDTSPTHARTVVVAEYLKALQERSGGRIQTELFSSGQLFRDRDVAKALRQGGIEMAIPGTWVLTGFVPDADVFQLPSFFGQPQPMVFAAVDGGIGRIIDDQLESKLDVKLLGPWLPLGYNNTYSTGRPLRSFTDLAGLKIRNSGGAGQAIRAKFFEAQPNMTAWPDVPLALSQGTFDAVSSTDESLASAKLWDSGIKFGFADHEFMGFYIPMISQSFYKKLPPDLQAMVLDVWKENTAAYRARMEAAQTEARRTLEAHGIVFSAPTQAALAEVRQRMMPLQDTVAKELRLSPALIAAVQADIKAGGS